MSVIKAILFYSKYNKKSVEFKRVLESLEIGGMYAVSVDAPAIRDAILNDEKYQIEKVPTVLVVYTSGMHQRYSGDEVDRWFAGLIENVNSQVQEAMTPISGGDYSSIPLQNDTPLPPDDFDNGYNAVASPSSSGVDSARAAMISEHIRDSGSRIAIEGDPPAAGRKEVKQPGISPMELAKQMSQQRESHDEEVDSKKPFM